MRNLFAILACVALAVLMAGTGGAMAQEAENASVGAEGCESIDAHVYVCEVDYDESDDTATLEFYAVENQSVDLLDVGAALADQTEQQERALRGGERTTISLEATETDDVAAVMIGTERNVVKTEILAEPTTIDWLPSLPGSPSSLDWITATIAALFSSTLVVGACGWWFKRGNGGGVRVF